MSGEVGELVSRLVGLKTTASSATGQKTFTTRSEWAGMLSRRRLLVTAGTAGFVTLTGCTASEWHPIKFVNETETNLKITLEASQADDAPDDGPPAESEVQERWRWLFWLRADESRGEDGPWRHVGQFYVRAFTEDKKGAEWVTSGETLEIRITERGIQMEAYRDE